MAADTPGRRIVFVNRFFFPDHSATAQILADLAFHLARAGWSVEVIAGRALYDDSVARLRPLETVHGVTIRRAGGGGGRLKAYLSFHIAAFFALVGTLRRGDVVVAKTDPPLLSVTAGLAAWMRGARLVNWLQDVYPEVGAQAGEAICRGPLGAVLKGLRNASLRGAAANVAIGERMAARLKGQGAARVSVVENWVDDRTIRPMAPGKSASRRDWGFSDDDFVVAYSGNLGRAHEAQTMLSAARRLKDHPAIRFLFIGGGRGAERIAALTSGEGLANVVFQPYQPRERLADSLAAADIHWLSLHPAMEGLIVPSKFYGVAAAGRAVIVIGDAAGEIGAVVRENDLGRVFAPGEDEALASALESLAGDRALVEAMGLRARNLLDARYAQQRQLERWREVLGSVGTTAAM